MGKLIRDLRLEFTWSWRDFQNPVLVDEDGNVFDLKVESDCPFLAASAAQKSKCGQFKSPESYPRVGYEQGLNVEPCAFGSHNFVTDTSHEDFLHCLNEQFVPPLSADHISE